MSKKCKHEWRTIQVGVYNLILGAFHDVKKCVKCGIEKAVYG